MNIELLDAFGGGGHKTDDAVASHCHQHSIIRHDRAEEVVALLFAGVRFGHAYRGLETGPPHRHDLVAMNDRKGDEAHFHNPPPTALLSAVQRRAAPGRVL